MLPLPGATSIYEGNEPHFRPHLPESCDHRDANAKGLVRLAVRLELGEGSALRRQDSDLPLSCELRRHSARNRLVSRHDVILEEFQAARDLAPFCVSRMCAAWGKGGGRGLATQLGQDIQL